MSAAARPRRVVAGILLGLSLLMLRGLPAAAFVTQAVLDVVPDFAGGTFQRTGLISNPQGDVSGVQLMPIGLSGEWVRDARVLPVPLQELTATSWGNRIYVMGGRLADGQFSKRVFVLRLADDGSIAAVQDAPQLPVELVGASSFVHETGGVTSIYVVGGLTKATDPVSRAVYRANIDPVTGLTGAWQKLPDNQSLPFGLYYSALAVRGSDVYLVGGIAYAGKFQTVPNVFRTHVLPSGDLTGWDSLIGPGGTNSQLPPSFAGGVAAARALVWEGEGRATIYLMGGRSSADAQTGDTTALVAVAAANIDAGGYLSHWWESGASLPVPLHGHGAVLVGGEEILLVGGRTDPNDPRAGMQSNVKAALIDPDNPDFPLYDWNPDPVEWNAWQTGVRFPNDQVRAYHGLVQIGDWVYALGGTDAANTATDTIFRGRISGVGQLYAPDGKYETPVITLYNGTDASMAPDVIRVEWEAVLPAGALALEYCWRPVNGSWTSWEPLGDSAPGANRVEFSPRLEDAAQIRFRALFTGDPPDFTRTPRLETLRVVYDAPPADLAVSLSADRSHVRPGDFVSFTAQYSNIGGVAAQGVEVECILPPYLQNQSLGWMAVGPQTFRYQVGNVPPGASGTVKLTALVGQIPEGAETLETLTSVSFPPAPDLDGNMVGDPNSANNSSLVSISATPLSITGTASAIPAAGTPLSPADTVEYRLNFAVRGGGGTRDVVLSVALDPNKLVDVQPLDGGYLEGNSVRWYLTGAVPEGYQGSVGLQARVKRPLANGTQIGLVFLGSSPDLPVAAVASLSHPVTSYPRLSMVGNADPSPASAVLRGQTVTYRFTVLNDGGDNASGVSVTAALPPEVQIVSVEPAASVSGQSVAWNLGGLTVDSPRELKIVGRIADTSAHGQKVIVGAELTGTGVPAISAQVQHTVRVPASLTITKTVDPAQGAVLPGQVLTYNVLVTNVGGETSGPITVYDRIPPFTRGLDGSAAGATLSWPVAGLAGGQSQSFQYQVRVDDPISETVREVLAPAAWATHGGVTVKSATLRTPLVHWPNLWVSVSDGRNVVKAGDRLTYTVAYGNYGGQTQDVELVAKLGPGLEWQGGSGWSPVGDGSYRLVVGSLGTEARSASFSARVASSIASNDPTLGLVAEVSIRGAASDADPYDDISKDIDIVAGPDLAILSISTTPASPYQGQYLSLHVEVGNLGADALGPYATGPQSDVVVLEVYARRAVSAPPAGPLDSLGGYCADQACGNKRPSFRATIPASSLTPGAKVRVSFPGVLHLSEAGLLDLYAQVDVGGDKVHGGFREGNEVNNLTSLRRFPVASPPPETGPYCLPMLFRNHG
ncbi:MAG: hypothetical protein ACOYEW_06515 [Anaerolineae bacterium]